MAKCTMYVLSKKSLGYEIWLTNCTHNSEGGHGQLIIMNMGILNQTRIKGLCQNCTGGRWIFLFFFI